MPASRSSVVSNVIWVMMGKRIGKTGKLMPSAPVAALALGMTFFYIYQLAKATAKPAPDSSSSTKKDS